MSNVTNTNIPLPPPLIDNSNNNNVNDYHFHYLEYKHDPSRCNQPNNDIVNQLLLPIVSSKIFCFLADTPQSVSDLSKVCHRWNHDIILGPDKHWEILCRNKWKYLSKNILPDSWQMFFRKRIYKLKKTIIGSWKGDKPDYSSVVPIENCDRDNKFINNIAKYMKLQEEQQPKWKNSRFLPKGMQWDFELVNS